MAEVRSIFCDNAETNFIRNRKLTFETTIKNIICMETGSLKDELLKLNDYSIETPTLLLLYRQEMKLKQRHLKHCLIISTLKLIAINCIKDIGLSRLMVVNCL